MEVVDRQEAGIPSSDDRKVRVNAEEECSTKNAPQILAGRRCSPLDHLFFQRRSRKACSIRRYLNRSINHRLSRRPI